MELQISYHFVNAKKIDELSIENRIEIDRSEAKKYEFIHESCVFSLLFFQANILFRSEFSLEKQVDDKQVFIAELMQIFG